MNPPVSIPAELQEPHRAVFWTALLITILCFSIGIYRFGISFFVSGDVGEIIVWTAFFVAFLVYVCRNRPFSRWRKGLVYFDNKEIVFEENGEKSNG